MEKTIKEREERVKTLEKN